MNSTEATEVVIAEYSEGSAEEFQKYGLPKATTIIKGSTDISVGVSREP
ncbi:hypothetical protein GCM10010525_23220 [Glutamicibacter bergerei]